MKFTQKQKWITAALIAEQIGSTYMEYKWWWEGNYHPFIVQNDGGFNNYSLGIDKVGHFYTSYMYSNILYELMDWGGFREKTKRTVSTLMPFVWALSIELGDGFSSFAFSPQDLTANCMGIAYAFAQKKYPFLENFKFKYSYYPSDYYINNNFKGWALTADYDGHIYWLSVDVYNLLPKTSRQLWPKYFNLIAGYGVTNFSAIDKAPLHIIPGIEVTREFHIGIDYNLKRIPVKNKTLSAFRNMADLYHFPAPGVKKTGSADWRFVPILLN